MSELEQRQIALERGAIEQAAARYRAKHDGQRPSHGGAGDLMVQDIGFAMFDRLRQLRDLVLSTQAEELNQLLPAAHLLAWLKPEYWVVLTFNTALGHPWLPLGVPWTSLSFDIVARCREEIRLLLWHIDDKQEATRQLTFIERTQTTAELSQSRRVRAALRRVPKPDLMALEHRKWRLMLGDLLLRTLVECGGGWFLAERRRQGQQTPLFLTLSPEARTALQNMPEHISPLRLPMIVEPTPWRRAQEQERTCTQEPPAATLQADIEQPS